VTLCLIGYSYGHAVLSEPPPWWWAASRSRPCGGADYNPVPSVVWPVGSNQTIIWWVIAGDGELEVHGLLNTEGTTNFTNALPVYIEQPYINAQAFWTLSLIVPNVKCTGPHGLCTMQFWTNSGGGWYSCTTLNITCTGCGGGVPISRDDCVNATGLQFCPQKNGGKVLVPAGQTAIQIDRLVENTFTSNSENPNVFIHGNSSACMSAYHAMLCELYFAPCTSSSLYSKQSCLDVLSVCGLTEAEKNLYNCSVFRNVPSGSAARIGGLGLALLAVVLLVL